MAGGGRCRAGGALPALILAAAVWTGCGRAAAAPAAWPPERGPSAVGPLLVTDPLLAERLLLLAQRSATLRAGLDTLGRTRLKVIVATPEQVPALVPALAAYEAHHLGEVLPMNDRAGRLFGAIITVDLAELRRLASMVGADPSMLAGDIDRILIHELYGHVVPLARTGQVSGGCPDPQPDQSASSSCAIQRENRVRSELGLPPRTTYDLQGLAMGRLLAQRSRGGTGGATH